MADAAAAPPLSWQDSSHTQPELSNELPPEVVTCLQNARFLHLATCTHNTPHVSLMNYTYLPPSTPRPASLDLPATTPLVIMTTNPSSRKTLNLQANPRVALLVHDWISHRPPQQQQQTQTSPGERGVSPVRASGGSSLAALLMGLNTSSLGSISASINGEARVLARGSEEERWCKGLHLEANTFEEGHGAQETAVFARNGGGAAGGSADQEGDSGRSAYIEDEDVRVVVVRIRDGRIADWKGGVKDWVLKGEGEEGQQDDQQTADLVNGVS